MNFLSSFLIGRNTGFRIVSKTDTRPDLLKRLRKGMESLPKEIQGKSEIIDP
jgi:hypothetical protein